MFNDFVWDLYLEAGGKKVVDTFKHFLDNNMTSAYADFIDDLHKVYCPSEAVLESMSEELEDVITTIRNEEFFLTPAEDTTISVLEELSEAFKEQGASTDKESFNIFSESLAYFSTLLARAWPELFVPYYFQCNYNVLMEIAEEFDIDLPDIPAKKDYKARFYFYGKISNALISFQQKHGLSSYELYAFLYDFAPNYIGGCESYIIKDLPEPRSAYFIGGSKEDAFFSEGEPILVPWQCSPNTRAGDMIVMYLRSPVSAVDSVWRSVSVGFNDPFFYYYRCTYIARPRKIQRVTQKDLQKDDIFKNVPIVRKNMQGINGVELKPSEYNHLLNLGKADKHIPRLKFSAPNANQKFSVEKDVENKLIKPLIKRLGYADTDYVQQLYIKIGNHNHLLIPDFVLLPKRTGNHQSAFCVIEAKLSIENSKKLEETKTQARSYAVQLRARYSVIISQEGIWVTNAEDDFSEEIFVADWGELKKSDSFSKLYKLIGKKN